MRPYRNWAAFVGVAFCSALPVEAQAPHNANKPPREFGGWQSVSRPANPTTGIKQANFQAPGQNFDNSLPPIPPGFGGASMPVESGSPQPQYLSAPEQLPSTSLAPRDLASRDVVQAGGATAAFDQFSHPGGHLPPTDVRQASGSGLRDVSQANAPVYPPQSYPQASYPQPGAGQGVYPPQSSAQPQSNLRSIPAANVAQQRQMHNGTEYNVPVVSQDPRFVSPPPAPRTGNYATSPYQAPFRLAAYQVNQQVPAQGLAAQSVPAPMGQTGQPAVVANTSALPQFQPTVGVHSVGYQYCGPSIPANGVPQVVPGAVAPPTLPPNLTPQLYTPDNAGYKPLFSLGQENYNVLLGRGIIGQPTVYVPGQPFRNFFRYLAP